jgi:hypothetical protein
MCAAELTYKYPAQATKIRQKSKNSGRVDGVRPLNTNTAEGSRVAIVTVSKVS